MANSQQTVSRKKNSSFITKLTVGLLSVGLIVILGLLVVAINFTDASAGFITSIATTPTKTPTQSLAELQLVADQANKAGNRRATIDTLVKMRSLASGDKQVDNQLAQLYYEQGIEWRDSSQFDSARQSFGWALSVKSDFADARQEQQWIDLYLTGIDDYQNADWNSAASTFAQIYQQNPTYLQVDEILYSAYFNLGIVHEAAGQLSPALESYRQAVEILPAALEAKQKVEEVALKLNPPTPEPTPEIPNPAPERAIEKRIVVDISDQRSYLYENDELTTEFIISTGEPGRDTAIGEFEIQSQIPMAYASTWNLDMPFWLGIYWAGPLENGFHAVPTVRDTGVTMWDGYLGQRVSYGCIILSMEDAETLYNWVDMGTPVSIVP